MPTREGDDQSVELAAQDAEQCVPQHVEYNRENRFVHEDYGVPKSSGCTRSAVPEALGELSADIRQAAYTRAELAKQCGQSAPTITMHLYSTLAHTFNWRYGSRTTAEGVLRRIANDGLTPMTGGGADGIYSFKRSRS